MSRKTKILCVDDEQNVLNALRRLFLDSDMEVLTATSGREGLGILEQEAVQLVISDYRMPGMNGVEFLREVRQRWPYIVRIVLSGYADTASIISAVNEGQIYKFIPKPWNDDELAMIVSHALERYALHRKNFELTVELEKKNHELLQLNHELEKLLEEKSAHLEFRSRALALQQNILESIPVGIVGIDAGNVAALCNALWLAFTGTGWGLLGQDITQGLSGELQRFVDETRASGAAVRKTALRGVEGTLSGMLMDNGDGQKGVIVVFIPDNAAAVIGKGGTAVLSRARQSAPAPQLRCRNSTEGGACHDSGQDTYHR